MHQLLVYLCFNSTTDFVGYRIKGMPMEIIDAGKVDLETDLCHPPMKACPATAGGQRRPYFVRAWLGRGLPGLAWKCQ